MLRVLTLSTLFPNGHQPTLGVFVERQTLGLAECPEMAVAVVAPVGLPPWPLSLHPHYAPLAKLPLQERWKGLAVHRPRYRVWPRFGNRFAAAALADSLLPIARAFRPDVIDAEYFWPDGPAAMRIARTLRIPFSIKARGSDIYLWGDRPGIAEQIVEAADAAAGLLAVSADLKREMAARGMPEAKIRIHHTGIDLDRFRPADRLAAKAALGLSGPLIATPGALIPRKGQVFAIETLEAVPDATLILIGDGPDRAMLERLAQRRGLASRIHFLGARPHEEMARWLAVADVTLLPSAAEGLANAWIESLACGTPVVTTDVGGARDAIDRPEAGRIVAREPAALAAAVKNILADPPAPEAVRRAAERFSWDKNAAKLSDHLRGIAVASRAAKLPVGGQGGEQHVAGGAAGTWTGERVAVGSTGPG